MTYKTGDRGRSGRSSWRRACHLQAGGTGFHRNQTLATGPSPVNRRLNNVNSCCKIRILTGFGLTDSLLLRWSPRTKARHSLRCVVAEAAKAAKPRVSGFNPATQNMHAHAERTFAIRCPRHSVPIPTLRKKVSNSEPSNSSAVIGITGDMYIGKSLRPSSGMLCRTVDTGAT